MKANTKDLNIAYEQCSKDIFKNLILFKLTTFTALGHFLPLFTSLAHTIVAILL